MWKQSNNNLLLVFWSLKYFKTPDAKRKISFHFAWLQTFEIFLCGSYFSKCTRTGAKKKCKWNTPHCNTEHFLLLEQYNFIVKCIIWQCYKIDIFNIVFVLNFLFGWEEILNSFYILKYFMCNCFCWNNAILLHKLYLVYTHFREFLRTTKYCKNVRLTYKCCT